MTTRSPSLRSPSPLRSALRLMTLWLMLEQIGLGLLVFALVALWLRVPDASALDVVASVCLAVIVIGVAGAGESALMLRVADRARTRGRLARGVLLMLFGVALWFAWSAVIDHLRGASHSNDNLIAGYLNSRLPHQLRYFFSYEHILLWLGWMWTGLEWIGAGVITIFVFAGTASERPLRAIACALTSATYWIVLVLGILGAIVLTGLLTQWTPGHGLRVEMLSLVVRLGAAVLIDAAVGSLSLAILGVCVRRSDSRYSTPAGTPDESQPRTADEP